MRPIRRIIVHHTDSDPWTSAAAVRAWHTAAPPQGRGWSDIGYHLLVRQQAPGGEWMTEPGRPIAVAGAHDEGENADSIGVAIAGDYSDEMPEPDGWTLLVQSCADLLIEYHIPIHLLRGHREDEPRGSATTCPGFSPADLRAAVARELHRRHGARTSAGGLAGEAVLL